MKHSIFSSQPRLSFRLALLLICSAVGHLANADNFPVSYKTFVFDSPAEAATRAVELSAPSDQAAACMQCHDGTAAQAVTAQNSDMPAHLRRDSGDNHPVGMDYARFADQNPDTYVALSALDQRIKLENGAVTCVSCHQVKTSATANTAQTESNTASGCTSSKSLTTGANQGRLCMSCHIM